MTIELPGYEEVQLLGRGGFSQVYRARQVEFDRWVAIKVLDVGLDARERAAFERECRAMGVVSQHPNIVTVLSAVFTADGRPALVMELYGGGTYADRVKREGPLPANEVLDVGIRISGALQTAHDRGLLHRDVKPNNLFVSDYGEPALGDFGLSSFVEEDAAGGGLTIHYAAPEVIERKRATAASDIYALAVTLYTLVSGRRPFALPGEGQRLADVALRILREAPPRIGGSCPPQLERAILRGMAKRPEDRPASAASFGRLLQAAQEGIGTTATELTVARAAVDGDAPGRGDASSLDDGSATILRPAAPTEPQAPAVDPEPEPAVPRRRGVLSVIAGVAAVVLLVGGGLLAAQGDLASGRAGGSDGANDDATDPDPAVAEDEFFVRVDPPDAVSVSRRSDGRVVVSWSVQPGLRYEVERVDAASDQRITVEEGEVSFEVDDGEVPCVVVRAISEAGQLSRPSTPACLPG